MLMETSLKLGGPVHSLPKRRGRNRMFWRRDLLDRGGVGPRRSMRVGLTYLGVQWVAQWSNRRRVRRVKEEELEGGRQCFVEFIDRSFSLLVDIDLVSRISIVGRRVRSCWAVVRQVQVIELTTSFRVRETFQRLYDTRAVPGSTESREERSSVLRGLP